MADQSDALSLLCQSNVCCIIGFAGGVELDRERERAAAGRADLHTHVLPERESESEGHRQEVRPDANGIGWIVLQKAKGEGVVKVEKNDDVLLVNLGNHPKHCSHLLK